MPWTWDPPPAKRPGIVAMMAAPLSPPPRSDPQIAFVSLGMVVLDELRFPDGRTIENLPGGSGLYSTLGARLLSLQGEAETLGCIVLGGDDFPLEVVDMIQSWGVKVVNRWVPHSESTRGVMKYKTNDLLGDKTFEYLTTPLRPSPYNFVLEASPFLEAKAVHILGTPAELEDTVFQLVQLRRHAGISRRPIVVWEPLPGSCTYEHRHSHLRAARLVDVFSPNHLELIRIMEDPLKRHPNATANSGINREDIEAMSLSILSPGVGIDGQGAIVVRCAEHGHLTIARSYPARWFPTLHDSTSPNVVDTTGAGNAFLGGFAMELSRGNDLTTASISGAVAAGFVIEQVGTPVRTVTGDEELWNGVTVASRISRYREHLHVLK